MNKPSLNALTTSQDSSVETSTGDLLPEKPATYRAAFLLVLKRDLTIALRHKDDIINPLLFFVIVVTLFPLGIGPEANTLSRIAPGIIWVAALLATFRSAF